MNRRSVLVGAGAVAATLSIAGCVDTETDEIPVDGSQPYPEIRESQLADWTLIDQRAEDGRTEFAGVGITHRSRIRIYENRRLSEEIAEKTFAQFDGMISSFVAVRTELEGSGAALVTDRRVVDVATATLTSDLQEMGVENVREVDPKDPIPAVGNERAVREIVGRYPLEEVTIETELPGGEPGTFVLEEDDVPVRGVFAAWKPERRIAFVAGGMYLDDNYVRETATSVTGAGLGDGIDVAVSVDLNLDPATYRRELIDLVELVE